MKFIFHRHKNFWSDWKNVKKTISGAVLFCLALWLNVSAVRYGAALIKNHPEIFGRQWVYRFTN